MGPSKKRWFRLSGKWVIHSILEWQLILVRNDDEAGYIGSNAVTEDWSEHESLIHFDQIDH